MSQKTIHIPQIGAVVLAKSRRARRLSITLKPFHDVRVAIPRGISYANAEQFVYQRLAWIQRHQQRMQAAEQRLTVFDESTPFRTRSHRLQITRDDRKRLVVRVSDGLIRVNCPHCLDITAEDVQTAIRDGIEQAWRQEAKADLPERVASLAKRHGFSYKRLFIKNIRSRWGSCSAQNNINLSLHLMRLPDHLIDFIIVHELAHTVLKNHSPQFWARLDQIVGDAKALDAEVKHYNIRIY